MHQPGDQIHHPAELSIPDHHHDLQPLVLWNPAPTPGAAFNLFRHAIPVVRVGEESPGREDAREKPSLQGVSVNGRGGSTRRIVEEGVAGHATGVIEFGVGLGQDSPFTDLRGGFGIALICFAFAFMTR